MQNNKDNSKALCITCNYEHDDSNDTTFKWEARPLITIKDGKVSFLFLFPSSHSASADTAIMQAQLSGSLPNTVAIFGKDIVTLMKGVFFSFSDSYNVDHYHVHTTEEDNVPENEREEYADSLLKFAMEANYKATVLLGQYGKFVTKLTRVG
jgi:hypothetical protein